MTSFFDYFFFHDNEDLRSMLMVDWASKKATIHLDKYHFLNTGLRQQKDSQTEGCSEQLINDSKATTSLSNTDFKKYIYEIMLFHINQRFLKYTLSLWLVFKRFFLWNSLSTTLMPRFLIRNVWSLSASRINAFWIVYVINLCLFYPLSFQVFHGWARPSGTGQMLRHGWAALCTFPARTPLHLARPRRCPPWGASVFREWPALASGRERVIGETEWVQS